MTTLIPRTKVPSLKVETVAGKTWELAAQQPENFTLVVFYRGYHCPVCKGYLSELDDVVGKFNELGLNLIAISSDNQERAEKTKAEWGLKNVPLGYGLGLDKAREWGLYVSKAIKESEPDQFSEPGLFLIRPDGTLYAASIQTMPFARPSFDQLIGAVQYILKNNYPARGEA